MTLYPQQGLADGNGFLSFFGFMCIGEEESLSFISYLVSSLVQFCLSYLVLA